jgi:hypothetical protein
MNYETFQPHPDLEALVKCYWTLEVPVQPAAEKQRILPDGCIDMCFILGDDIKRYTSDTAFILQPRAMILGQINEPFYVEPTGVVNCFAVRFYPYGFAHFTTMSIADLANKETELRTVFGGHANKLSTGIIQATATAERISIVEKFLREKLNEQIVVDSIVKSTIDVMLQTRGAAPINSILKDDLSKRRQLERKFSQQVGISPKQLGKVIRLQAALKMLLHDKAESLTAIAYENQYFDQAHFTRDFKEFTGVTPKEFFTDDSLALSALIYSKD